MEGTHAYRVGTAGLVAHNCHHGVAGTYRNVYQWADDAAQAADLPGCRMLGVTATMSRAKGKGLKLGDVWQDCVLERGLEWAIMHGPSADDEYTSAPVGEGAEHGWLIRPRGVAVVLSDMDLDSVTVSKTTGDYAEAELGDMITEDADQIVKAWRAYAVDARYPEGRPTVVFVPDVASAQAVAAEYRGAGVTAEVVTGTTPARERGDAARGTGIYGRLAKGETRVLVGVGVPTEGWDLPAIACVVMARPTKLAHLYQQCVGRGLRPDWKAVAEGRPAKLDCLVIDCVGVTRRLHLRTLVDLLHGAEYDAAALPVCEACQLRPCVCPKDDPEPREPLKLQGPRVYTEVPMLASSDALWLETHQGRPFIPAMDRIVVLWQEAHGLYTCGWVPQKRDASGRYQPGKPITPFPVSLDEARRRAEAWATNYAPSYARRDAPWRKATSGKAAQPSEGQCALARDFGMRNPEGHTRAAVSDVISIGWASLRLDRVT